MMSQTSLERGGVTESDVPLPPIRTHVRRSQRRTGPVSVGLGLVRPKVDRHVHMNMFVTTFVYLTASIYGE
jgi:hypothetical protein